MKRLGSSALVLALLWAQGAAALADVKMAVIGPITGPNAVGGAQLMNGAKMAVDTINAAGGILGEKVELLVGDDVSDPKQGVSVANKMVGDSVKFVVGHYNSGVAIPTSEVFAENGVLMVTPAATNPLLTERGLWNTFRTCGRDDQQGGVLATNIINNHKGKKIAIIHDKTPYGQGLADEAKKGINAAGINEVLYEGVNVGEKDFSALITKMKNAGAETLLWGGLHTEGGLILRQIKDAGLKMTVMGGDGLNTSELAAIAGDAVEGTEMSFGPDARKSKDANEVVKKFRDSGYEPEAYTLYSYAAVQVMQQAAEAAGSLEPQKVAEKMRTGMTFKTVLGEIAYNQKGDRTGSDFVIYTWKKMADGTFAPEQTP